MVRRTNNTIIRRRRPMRRRPNSSIVTSNRNYRPSITPVAGSLPARYNPNPEPPIIPINYVFTRRIRITPQYDNQGDFVIPVSGIAASIRLPGNIISLNWHLVELRGPPTSFIALTHLSGITVADSGTQGNERPALGFRACQHDQVNYQPADPTNLFSGRVSPLPTNAIDLIMDIVVSFLTIQNATVTQPSPTPPDFAMISPSVFRPLSVSSPRR